MKDEKSTSPAPHNPIIHDINRREFSRIAAAGVAGLAAFGAAPAPTAGAAKRLPGLQREKRGGLYYRPLGATGLWISELALGGSPSPPPNVFLAAMERGVNYCDTSPRYTQGKGEEDIGRIIKGRRDKIYVGTKFTPTRDRVLTADDILRQVEGSLKRLGTDHIDILCVHGANSEEEVVADWVLDAIERLRKAGKARHFGASVHNTSPAFYRRMIESGKYEVLLVPFNMYYDPKMTSPEGAKGPAALDEILKLAAEKGVGIIAMKTLAAGGFAKVPAPEGVSPAQAKLRWVLRRPEVTSILNEMLTFEYLKEDLAASDAVLSPKEEAWLRDCARKGSDEFCRMCRACEARCPAALPIADLLRARMYGADYGDPRRAAELAIEVDAASHLAACRDCGSCEAACPWRVQTRRLLEELRSFEQV